MASQADRIRQHVMERYVRPFLDAKEATLSIQAGDVVRSMGLVNRTRAVCSALEGRKFQREAEHVGLEYLDRTGPPESTTTRFHYKRKNSPKTSIEMHTEKQWPDRPPAKAVATQRPKAPTARNAKLPAADLCLVSCVKTKQSHQAPARDLYISDWFAKVRKLVEAQGWPWFILSAKHGLVRPDKEIARYEKRLLTMRVAERRAWASDVMQALECHLGGVRTVVVFAGQPYREFLVPEMRERGVQVEVPMERLKFGEQLAWLNDRIKH